MSKLKLLKQVGESSIYFDRSATKGVLRVYPGYRWAPPFVECEYALPVFPDEATAQQYVEEVCVPPPEGWRALYARGAGVVFCRQSAEEKVVWLQRQFHTKKWQGICATRYWESRSEEYTDWREAFEFIRREITEREQRAQAALSEVQDLRRAMETLCPR